MKGMGWIVAVVLLIIVGFDQFTIARNQETIATYERTVEDLQNACAVYHRSLTGQLHPLYKEREIR